MVEFVNLTPHEVVIAGEDTPSPISTEKLGEYIIRRIPPSGIQARLATERKKIGEIEGIPIVKTVFGELMPKIEPKPGTYYIVSAPICAAVNREDFLAPDTTPAGAVRDEKGQIVAVKALVSCKA